jgi:hypothetical protein
MVRPRRPERNRAARSFRQLKRFHHVINSDKVFGTHGLSLLLDLPKKGRQAFQPRRRKHPGAPISPPRRLCRQPRPRRVPRDHRSATPRSTPRNSLLPTLIAASFFITCSRALLLNLLRQSALIERAALSGRRRHKAAHANAIGNNEGAGDSGARTPLPCRPLSPIWSGTVMTDEAAAAPSRLRHRKLYRNRRPRLSCHLSSSSRLESSTR